MRQMTIALLCAGLIGGVVQANNTAPKVPPKGKITSVMTQMILVPASRVQSVPLGVRDQVTKVNMKDFRIMKSEVTGALWSDVYVWAIEKGYKFQHIGEHAGTGKPITRISWNDAIVWANAYSEKSAFTPVYRTNKHVLKDAHRVKAVDVVVVPSANGYQLPTHKQWELAARWIGKTKPTRGMLKEHAISASGVYWTPAGYASGAMISIHEDIPEYNGTFEVASFVRQKDFPKNAQLMPQNSDRTVCTKRSNALKICDMSGNALEWGSTVKRNEHGEGIATVFGGHEANDLSALGVESVSTSDYYKTNQAYKGIGFRLVRNVP